DEVRLVREVLGGQVASVETLAHGDAIVAAQAPGQLAVGDVERHDVRGAGLQQAVGEAPGGRADVEAAAPGRVNPGRRERVRQLAAAPRDEVRSLGHRDDDVVGDELPRLGGRPAVAAQPDLAGDHARGGAAAA